MEDCGGMAAQAQAPPMRLGRRRLGWTSSEEGQALAYLASAERTATIYEVTPR